MAKFPDERQGFTDMTFCLLRFEVSNIFRRILYVPPGPNRCTDYFAGLSIAEKEKWITSCHQKMEEKYLKDCDMSIPLCWVTATVSRLIMSKMWLIVYHPHQRKDGGATLPQEIKDKLFITSLENIEYSMLLETEARTMKWGWLFRTYVQWHAIAFLLSELCVRTKGEAVDRAWRALEATAGRWWFPLSETSPYRKGQQGCLWKPLRKLLAKAKAARAKEIALERASMALRNGHYGYDFAGAFDEMRVPAVSADQPSSETLDKMLRPTGPKLGEVPINQQPTWPTSPTLPKGNGSFSSPGSDLSPKQPTPDSKLTGTGVASNNSAQKLQDLSTFGLDQVLLDVMEDTTYEGTSVHNLGNFGSFANGNGTIMGNMNNAGHYGSTGLANGTPNLDKAFQSPSVTTSQSPLFPNGRPQVGSGYPQPTYGDAMFSNPSMDFNNISPPLGASGPQTDSPLMDGGQMDWTLWDDMVNQYGGGDGQNANPANAPAPGHLGMVSWF